MKPTEQLVNHWREVYLSENPEKELIYHDGEAPSEIRQYFQFDIYPEPFYGYLNEDDLSDDALLLLINPGEYNGNESEVSHLNRFIKERYTTWTKEDYLNEAVLLEKINPKGLIWRNRMKKQVERVIPSPKKVNFLHTIELFPYHSKRWTKLSEKAKSWLIETQTTKLNFLTIKYLVETRKINYIIGIGINWVDIFAKFGYKPSYSKRFFNEKGNLAHRIFIYRLSKSASPILIYVANAVHLPKNPEVVKYFESLLSY